MLYLRKPFYLTVICLAVLSGLGIWLPLLYKVAIWAIIAFCLIVILDAADLLVVRLKGQREMSAKVDLGEKNKVKVSFNVLRGRVKKCYLIEEYPTEFLRNFETLKFDILSDRSTDFINSYVAEFSFFPTKRGRYELGRSLVYISNFGILERRLTLVEKGETVDVYPSFSHLREKEQQVRSLQTMQLGMHHRQLPANQTEFRDIREYVPGDDIRTINWKATARTQKPMVNEYEDERSQYVINIIDCGLTMHRTFSGLTLQDHAINTSLLVSYSALETEDDCVGVGSFGPDGVSYLPPRSGKSQLASIMHHLYDLTTSYGKSDIESLCMHIDRSVKRRSLIILYTDYSNVAALNRELPFLKRISSRHCLLVVICKDNELEDMSEEVMPSADSKASLGKYIQKSLASDMVIQKQLIYDSLTQNGIHCLNVSPSDISFSVLQKYIELKARRAW